MTSVKERGMSVSPAQTVKARTGPRSALPRPRRTHILPPLLGPILSLREHQRDRQIEPSVPLPQTGRPQSTSNREPNSALPEPRQLLLTLDDVAG